MSGRESKKTKRVLLVLNLVLLLAVAYMFAGPLPIPTQTASVDESPGGLKEDGGTGKISVEKLPALDREGYRDLIAVDLFRIDQRESVTPEETAIPEEGDEYELPDIYLSGTISGGNANARAFIKETESGKAKIYSVGDFIEELQIESIAPRRITLTRAGEQYEVSMDFTGLRSENERSRRGGVRDGSRNTGTVVVGRGGVVAPPDDTPPDDTPREETLRGRWRDRWENMDEDEREEYRDRLRQRREALRERLEDADPETRERILQRIDRAEQRRREFEER